MAKRKLKTEPSIDAPVADAAPWLSVESVHARAKADAAIYNAECDALKGSIKRRFLSVLRECFAAGARILAVEYVDTFLATLEGQAKVNVNVASAYARRIAGGLASGFEPSADCAAGKDCHALLTHSEDLQTVASFFPKLTSRGGGAKVGETTAPKAEKTETVKVGPVTRELVIAWIQERATAADRANIMALTIDLSIAKVTTAEARVALAAALEIAKKIAA